MENGKTSKPALPAGRYLKYAIGEIFLVVIGILLALQINSWNEERIENKKEIALLNGLMEEFQYNLGALETSMKVNNNVSRSCVELTRFIRSNSINNAPEIVDSLLLAIGAFQSFDARTGVSGEIINSGKMSIIKNGGLRAQLGNWHTLLTDSEEDLLFRSDNYTTNLMPFLMKRFPLANGELTKKLSFDNNNYLEAYQEKSPFKYNLSQNDLLEFENQVWHHKHNHDYVVINEFNIRDFINNTIQMIDDELKKKL